MSRSAYTYAAVILLTCSCVRAFEPDTGGLPLLVVDCILHDKSPQSLSLSYSWAGVVDMMEPITEAEVVLYDKTSGEEVGRFTNQGAEEWALDYSAIPGHRYRLEVSVPGYGNVYAEDTMPDPIGILVKHIGNISTPGYDFSGYGEDFVNANVYYVATLPEYAWIYALNYNPETGEREIAEQICTDYPWVDNFNLSGETYKPDVSEKKEEGHIYCLSSYPFLEGRAIHKRFLRICAPDQDGQEDSLSSTQEGTENHFVVSGSFSGDYLLGFGATPAETEGYVVAMSASENYDRYLRDAIRVQQMQESSELSSIYFRDNLYSNINGGLGIFGASVSCIQSWIRYTNLKIRD